MASDNEVDDDDDAVDDNDDVGFHVDDDQDVHDDVGVVDEDFDADVDACVVDVFMHRMMLLCPIGDTLIRFGSWKGFSGDIRWLRTTRPLCATRCRLSLSPVPVHCTEIALCLSEYFVTVAASKLRRIPVDLFRLQLFGRRSPVGPRSRTPVLILVRASPLGPKPSARYHGL